MGAFRIWGDLAGGGPATRSRGRGAFSRASDAALYADAVLAFVCAGGRPANGPLAPISLTGRLLAVNRRAAPNLECTRLVLVLMGEQRQKATGDDRRIGV